jgi:hypothetical protein
VISRFHLTGSQLVATALLCLVGFLYALAPLSHTDVWAHLRFGQWMMDHGSSPEREPFCELSDPEIQLINFPWLAQLTSLGAFRLGEYLAGGDEVRRFAGGVAGLRSLSFLLAALASIFFLAAYARASGSILVGAMGLLAYNLLAPGGLGVLRPQLFGVALFALYLWALAGPMSWRPLLVLALAMAAWANLHGSFVMGLALIGAHLGGRLLEAARPEGRSNLSDALADPQARWLLVTLAACSASALANPYGPMLYLHVLTFGRNPTVRTFDEFQPLSFTLGPAAMWLFVASWLLLLGSWALARKGPTPTALLLVLLFGVFPAAQRRMLVWWLPLVPFLAAPAWAALLDRWRGTSLSPETRSPALTGAAALAVLCLVLVSPPVSSLARGPAPLSTALVRGTPWELALILDGVNVPGERARKLREGIVTAFKGKPFHGKIFATEAAAEVLVWRGPIPSHVVVYTHIHLFNMTHWTACMKVKAGEKGWDVQLDRWKVNLIVAEPSSALPLCQLVSRHPDWRVLDGRLDELSSTGQGPIFIAVRKKPL